MLTKSTLCAIITDMLSRIGFLGFFAPSAQVFLNFMICAERTKTEEQTKTNPTGLGQLVPKLAPVSAGLEALV